VSKYLVNVDLQSALRMQLGKPTTLNVLVSQCHEQAGRLCGSLAVDIRQLLSNTKWSNDPFQRYGHLKFPTC